jgi:hypothetical protein
MVMDHPPDPVASTIPTLHPHLLYSRSVGIEPRDYRPSRPLTNTIIMRIVSKLSLGIALKNYKALGITCLAGRLQTGRAGRLQTAYQLEISLAKEIAKVEYEGHPLVGNFL